MKKITEVTIEELAALLKGKFDYVLELSILQEPQFCIKPVHKFERAFIDSENSENFYLIYSEADDPETIFVSYNSDSCGADKMLQEYNARRIIFYNKNGDCESYYYNPQANTDSSRDSNIRILTPDDKNLTEPGNNGGVDYLNIIFEDFIEKKIWHDCGIAGAFDKFNNFMGYLAYYELAENICDISYIFVKQSFRGLGYAKELLNYFKNKNTRENKISYYSYAADKASANLAKSCGFVPCAKRYEREI